MNKLDPIYNRFSLLLLSTFQFSYAIWFGFNKSNHWSYGIILIYAKISKWESSNNELKDMKSKYG